MQTALYTRIELDSSMPDVTENIVIRNAQKIGITLVKCEPRIDENMNITEYEKLRRTPEFKQNADLCVTAAEASDRVNSDGTVSCVSIYPY